MPTNVGILTFMSMTNFEHENSSNNLEASIQIFTYLQMTEVLLKGW